MTAEQFVYWLQGYFEIAGLRPETGCTLTNEQVKQIMQHLALVFNKQTPPQTQPYTPPWPNRIVTNIHDLSPIC